MTIQAYDSGIVVVEGFEAWDQWYSEKRICTTELKLAHDVELGQNCGVILKGEGTKVHGIVKGGFVVPAQLYHPHAIKPLNSEQTVALHLLWDDTIPLVILAGAAGSGKTLLSTAHSMEQLLERQSVKRLIIAKSITPVGRDIGYLKGDLKEKVWPWLGSFRDNALQIGYRDDDLRRCIDSGMIEVEPITFIQGRSITDAIMIIDEVQNLEPKVVKQIVTRAGKGTKVILLGDPTQRFEKGEGNGLEHILQRCGGTPLVGHVVMRKSVRSDLANWAVEAL